MNSTDQDSTEYPLIDAARRLWYGSYHGMLATHSTNPPGYPFGSLVPVCRDEAGSPLLLLSHLAQHTQNLHGNPHCSLMLAEQGKGDIQQSARLTCLARIGAQEETSENLKLRYFRYFPDSREYHERLNFRFYRLIPQKYYFIGGFGAARWFDPSRLVPDSILRFEEEAERREQIQSHPLYIKADTGGLSLVGVDSYGLDIRSKGELSRFNFPVREATPKTVIEQILQTYRG